MKCQTCGKTFEGRKRKYCQPSCWPTYYEIKGAGLTHCQICGTEIEESKTGRPKRNCSKKCRLENRARNLRKQPITKNCEICEIAFTTSKDDSRFCSTKCRSKSNAQRQAEKHKLKMNQKYPNGFRTVTCGWCGEPRTFKIGESVANAYHSDCSKEAQVARYRIKTVKRQKLTQPHRISHEQVVREYGADCSICGEPIDLELPRTHRFGLTVDHLIPVKRGGTGEMSNLRPAHWICNIKKSDKMPENNNA